MSSEPKPAQIISPNANSGKIEARAILLLLMSAEASLQAHVCDADCINILKSCISRIQKQYSLTDRDVSEGIVWREASIGAILRLLDYVTWEVQEKLGDLQSVQELGLCIDRLTSPTKLSQ